MTDHEKTPKNPSPNQAAAVHDSSAIILNFKGQFAWVRERANAGCQRAAKDLVTAAYCLCKMVEEFEAKQPKLARALARHQAEWPLMIGRDPASLFRAKERLRRLRLGEARADSQYVVPKKGKRPPNLDSVANHAAAVMMRFIRMMRRHGNSENPEINRAVSEAKALPCDSQVWANYGWNAIVLRNRGDILNNHDLARIGKAAFDQYMTARENAARKRRAIREKGTEIQRLGAPAFEKRELAKASDSARNKQRGSIKRQVKQAFLDRYSSSISRESPVGK